MMRSFHSQKLPCIFFCFGRLSGCQPGFSIADSGNSGPADLNSANSGTTAPVNTVEDSPPPGHNYTPTSTSTRAADGAPNPTGEGNTVATVTAFAVGKGHVEKEVKVKYNSTVNRGAAAGSGRRLIPRGRRRR